MAAMLKPFAEQGFDSTLKQLCGCFTAIILNLLSIFRLSPPDAQLTVKVKFTARFSAAEFVLIVDINYGVRFV
ncbi:MAG: hypothetical protein WCD53_13805 [Microcoleus sp.]